MAVYIDFNFDVFRIAPWRPNLRDEANNHLMELAVAGGAEMIITANKKDFRNSELNFPSIKILNPAEFLNKGASLP